MTRSHVVSLVRAVAAAALLAVLSGAVQAAPAGRLVVRGEALELGRAGTRALGRRQVVLESGMAGDMEFLLPPGAAGRDGETRIRVRLDARPGQEGATALHVVSRVQVAEPGGREEAAAWTRERDLQLRPGSSALMEVAPAASSGARLALSLTLAEAAAAEMSAPPQRIDLDLEVAAVDGEEVAVLDHPMLSTLSGHPVTFAVDYPVPSPDGDGFDHVRLDVRLTPGFPQEGRVPLDVSLAGGFPGDEGPVLGSRDDRRVLSLGETWELAVRAPGGGDPWLRVRVVPLWRPPEGGDR